MIPEKKMSVFQRTKGSSQRAAILIAGLAHGAARSARSSSFVAPQRSSAFGHAAAARRKRRSASSFAPLASFNSASKKRASQRCWREVGVARGRNDADSGRPVHPVRLCSIAGAGEGCEKVLQARAHYLPRASPQTRRGSQSRKL